MYVAAMPKLIDHPIVPRSDFEIERTPEELWDWFTSRELELDEYHSGQRAIIADDEEFLDQVLWHPNARFFWDEIRPIAHCARVELFGENALIIISTQCEPYDAIVVDKLTEEKIFLEATSTMDGQDQRMNYRHVKQYGRSPAFQKIRYEGNNNTGFDIPNVYESDEKPIAVGVDEVASKLWDTINTRIKEKEKKGYPDKTWLIVSFEDFLTFNSEDRMVKILEALLTIEVLGKSQFSSIVLAGCAGRILINADNRETPRTSVVISAPERSL